MNLKKILDSKQIKDSDRVFAVDEDDAIQQFVAQGIEAPVVEETGEVDSKTGLKEFIIIDGCHKNEDEDKDKIKDSKSTDSIIDIVSLDNGDLYFNGQTFKFDDGQEEHDIEADAWSDALEKVKESYGPTKVEKITFVESKDLTLDEAKAHLANLQAVPGLR